MKPKSMNISAQEVGDNHDLLTQLLLRLPTKSLLKFKCVSKQWLSLISDPHFCLSHTSRRPRDDDRFIEPTALLLKVQYIASPEFDVVPLKHFSKVPFFDYISSSNFNMIQSCNGLFLLESLDEVEDEDDNDVDVSCYFICNPTTKKFKKLSFPRNPIKDCEFFVSLAFDPLKSPHYKLIVAREVTENSYVFEMDIFVSETNCWKVSEFVFEADGDLMAFEDAVFCNAKLHWNSYGDQSLYFDDENESFRIMPMPTPLSGHNQLEIHRYFGEINGSLHLAVTYHACVALDLDVHRMSSDYSHWFLKHRLNLGDAVKVFPELNNLGCHPYVPGFSGASFVGSETKNEAKVVIWADGKIICYDFGDAEWKMVYDPGSGLKFGTHHDSYNHLHEQRFISYKYFENLSCI